MGLTYKIQSDADIAVRLDGRKVGEIRLTPQGFRYFPKGSEFAGEAFPTLALCKGSLEDEDTQPNPATTNSTLTRN